MSFSPIAIVGRACLLPGADGPEALWKAVNKGRDLLSRAPADRWRVPVSDILTEAPVGRDSPDPDCTWSDRGGYVHGFEEQFDPEGFAIPAADIRGMDPLVQWALHTARQAMDEVRTRPEASRMGLVMGNLSFPSSGLSRFAEQVWLERATAVDADAQAALELGRLEPGDRFMSGLPALKVAQALGLEGAALALDAACASSLVAIKYAIDQLHDGRADMMLAGAVNRADDLFIHVGFCALKAMSTSGRSRPFHAEADGLVPAEGAGFVALKRLDDALEDGDEIHGIIRGLGLSNDGRGRGMLAPSTEGQARAIRLALEQSGLTVADMNFVECHATGTQVGDATEIRSMIEAYGPALSERDEPLPIGSLKSNLGHLITAAGIAGLIKVLEAMKNGVRPPSLHHDVPHPILASSDFRVVTHAEPWDFEGDRPRRAAISAFGFGGNNAHLIVEQASFALDMEEVGPLEAPTGTIAIVGLGIAAGEASDRAAYTTAVLDGNGLVHDGEARTDTVRMSLTGLRFPPNDLRQALGQQTMLLQAAREALEERVGLPRETTGIFVGMGADPEVARYGARWRLVDWARRWETGDTWLASARDSVISKLEAAGVLGTMPNIPANRINSQFDLAGPSCTISAEEASGLRALELALRSLRAGELDAAVVGAVDLSCEPVHLAAARAILPEDRQVPGDGAVVLVLKRLSDAWRDGDSVLALLRDEGELQPDAPVFGLGDSGFELTECIGHAHAASGLLHLATAALCLHHRRLPRGRTWLSSRERQIVLQLVDMAGIPHTHRLDECVRSPSMHTGEPIRIRVYSGVDAASLSAAMQRGEQSNRGPARLVVVAEGDAQLKERLARATKVLENDAPPGPGVFLRMGPLGGQIAMVFGGAGAAYRGMGRELIRALPELGDEFGQRCRRFEELYSWVFRDSDPSPSVLQKLWASSALTQIHAHLSLGMLQLKPDVAIGYSSGETNALLALGAWKDLDDLVAESEDSGLFDRELAGKMWAVSEAWGTDEVEWKMWLLRAPLEQVEEAVRYEQRVHLAVIHTDREVIIAGEPAGCDRVIEAIGRSRAVTLEYDLAVHVPEVNQVADAWCKLHQRELHPVEGVRFYFGATGRAEQLENSERIAQRLLAQANQCLDFRQVVEQAWADGVRVFVEHGPQGATSRWIRENLGPERAEHAVIVSLDRPGAGLGALIETVGALIAAGQVVDYQALLERLGGEFAPEAVAGPTLDFAAHPAPISLPDLPARPERTPPPRRPVGRVRPDPSLVQHMAPPPVLAPVLAPYLPPQTAPMNEAAPRPIVSEPIVVPKSRVSVVPESRVSVPPGGAVAERSLRLLMDQVRDVEVMHRAFIARQQALHEHFMQMRRSMMGELARGSGTGQPKPTRIGGFSEAEGAPSSTPPKSAVSKSVMPNPISQKALEPECYEPGPPKPRDTPTEIVGLQLDRIQLSIHASGRISRIYGAEFARQDGYARQVRMPEPPLLLADRVLGLDAEPGSMRRGTIWTETDVGSQDWYLHQDRMPAGVMIESGQADLMLISYLGIDWHNQGERVYRLLGCELTYHGDLPLRGETLRYDIHVDGHANQGPIRLFFFHYDCRTRGQMRLSVRQGQAGFFTDRELAESAGILWTPETADIVARPRLDPPVVESEHHEFTTDRIRAFAEGRPWECFGAGFEGTRTHTRTPVIAGGRMRFLDRVTELRAYGGPWKRGYLRAELDLHADDWFLDGHFKNDPCMPGTLMFEGCLNAMAFLMTGMGFTIRRDGWRFQPVQDEPFQLRCRGQATPRSRLLVTEIYVEEVIAGPIPTLYADLLCTIDGLKAFHARRVGLQLVPDWPLRTCGLDLTERHPERVASVDGFAFDYYALMASAWGRPSEAFGSMYRPFDGPRTVARLPGPPYHFMSRVTRIDGDIGRLVAGTVIELEYDIPPDAWYFEQNGHRTMPFCVFLEAALQPCGWLASFVGSALTTDRDLSFRNLDGRGRWTAEVLPDAGTLRTRVEITRISKTAGMIIEAFDVSCFLGETQIYALETVFGFFPHEALENQVGLPTTDDQRDWLVRDCDFLVDLRDGPSRYCSGSLRLAGPMLRMLDRITGYWPDAGEAGLGVLRAEKDVDVGEWFFQAHFFQDPVQPGSLGIEAMLQTLQFYMIERGMGEGLTRPRFQPLHIGAETTWKYRGQVVPRNTLISTTMEILAMGRDEDGSPWVTARASLWVDGRRIYEAEPIGMRIVSVREPQPDSEARNPMEGQADPSPEPTETSIPTGDAPDPVEDSVVPDPVVPSSLDPDEVHAEGTDEVPLGDLPSHPDGGWWLDPGQHPWLTEHRPNSTVSVLPFALLIDLLARPSEGVPFCLEDVQVRQWVPMDVPRRLWIEEEDRRVLLYASDGEFEELVATARRSEPTSEPPAPLGRVTGPLVEDCGLEGLWTDGPDWSLLRSLVLGRDGASAVLDAKPRAVPVGAVHAAALHAIVQATPHHQLERWDPTLEGRIAWPVTAPRVEVFAPIPTHGELRCEVRYDGPSTIPGLPSFHAQILREDGLESTVLLRIHWVEACFEASAFDRADVEDRERFLLQRAFVPGLSLARREGDETILDTRLLSQVDWVPGTLGHVYGTEDPRTIARKEHLARECGLHPRHLPESLPLSVFDLDIETQADRIHVRTKSPSFVDGQVLRPWWRERLGRSEGILLDLMEGLVERFVHQLVLEDPRGTRQLGNEPVVFVTNHQVGLDALLLPWILSSLVGTDVHGLLAESRRGEWLGWLHEWMRARPESEPFSLLRFAPMDDAEELAATLGDVGDRLGQTGGSVLIAAEKQRHLSAGQPIRRLSSAVIELALTLDRPIVPIRCSSGLPSKPARKPLDFPTQLGRQSIVVGAEISPHVLRAMSTKARKDHVLDSLNRLGPGAEEERPLPGDSEFLSNVRKWSETRSEAGLPVSPAAAVILGVLRAIAEPSAATRRLVEAVAHEKKSEFTDPEGRWLSELGNRLAGWS